MNDYTPFIGRSMTRREDRRLLTGRGQYIADLDRLRCLMVRPVIVDLRNIYRADEMKRANFRYFTVGRPAAERSPETAAPRRRKAANSKSAIAELAEAL